MIEERQKQESEESGEVAIVEDHLNMSSHELREEVFGAATDSGLFDSAELPTTKTALSAKKFVVVLIFFLCMWQCFNHVSDTAIEKLVNVIATVLRYFGTSETFAGSVSVIFPTTVYMIKQWLSLPPSTFKRYVVCPECTFLYDPATLIYKDRAGNIQAKKCENVRFSTGKYSRPCGAKLMKRVILSDNKVDYYPLKLYCYKPISESLENLLRRDGVELDCNLWRHRKVPTGTYADVYDGKVWARFQNVGGKTFLADENNYALMVNCDWFQPFSRRSDLSIGVIYMTLQNLPRTVRFRRENLIIVGVIPSLQKEPEYLRYFLEPMTEELIQLWNPGKQIKTASYPDGILIRAALICVACDIPAARKFCGFMGHNATYGCSKCFKKFPGGVGKTDYSGFNKIAWPKRNAAQHRRDSRELLQARNPTQLKQQQSKFGCKFSPLVNLSYFDIVQFHVIDPMHNLYLGTAKKIFRFWIETEILTPAKLEIIQKRIDNMKAPSESSRIPHGIGTNWGNLNAYEWKEWTLVYSMYALLGLIDQKHLEMWQTFVLACKKITKPLVTKEDVMSADLLFIKFGKQAEKMLTKTRITPNMHLHCHLDECIANFGSIYGFWLFSFERYNGLLGSIPTNKKTIEVQLMTKFLQADTLLTGVSNMPEECLSVLQPILTNQARDYSAADIGITSVPNAYMGYCIPFWRQIDHIQFPKTSQLCVLSVAECMYLFHAYSKMYPNKTITTNSVPKVIWRYNHIYVANQHFGSRLYMPTDRYSLVIASWLGEDNVIDTEAEHRPCFVNYYFKHTLMVDEELIVHVFAHVEWPEKIKVKENDSLGLLSPLSAYYAKRFIGRSQTTFLPVQRIQNKAACAVDKIKGFDCLVIADVEPKLYI